MFCFPAKRPIFAHTTTRSAGAQTGLQGPWHSNRAVSKAGGGPRFARGETESWEGDVTFPGLHRTGRDPGPVFSDAHSSAPSTINTDILGVFFSLGLKKYIEINNVCTYLDCNGTGHFFLLSGTLTLRTVDPALVKMRKRINKNYCIWKDLVPKGG